MANVTRLLLVVVIFFFVSAVLPSFFVNLSAQPSIDQNFVTYEKESNFVKEFKIPVSEKGLNGITSDSHGNVWIHYSTNESSTVFKISKDGNNVTRYPIHGETLSDDPVIKLAGGQMLFDINSNAVWFTDARTNSLGKLNIDNGHMEVFPVPTNNSGIMGLVLSPDAKTVWFTQIIGNNIGALDVKTKKITEYPTEENSGPTLLAFDSEGVLWVTLSYANSVLKVEPWLLIPGITSSGMYKVSLEKPDYFSPFGIAIAEVNGKEKIFLSDHGSSRIITADIHSDLKNYTSYWTSPSTALPMSLPSQVASDKSGNVYFVEHGGNKIVRISSNDSIMTELDIPTGPLATSVFLTVSEDEKRVWFGEWASNKIGYIDTEFSEPIDIMLTDSNDNSSIVDRKPLLLKESGSYPIDALFTLDQNMSSETIVNDVAISIVGMTDSGLQGIAYTINPKSINLMSIPKQQVKIDLSLEPQTETSGLYTIMLRATFLEKDGLKVSVLHPIKVEIIKGL